MADRFEFVKAKPFPNERLNDLEIVFSGEPPEYRDEDGRLPRDWEAMSRDYWGNEGVRLKDALVSHLPGGLIDALLVALLDHKRSLFNVVNVSKDED